MVHALQESHRVLKPNGILIDLRPAPRHRRVGLGTGRRWQLVGVMREQLDDDLAADRAVAQVLRAGLFRREMRFEFELDRVMDTMEDFRAWLDEFVQDGKMLSHEWLVQRVERARAQHRASIKIVVRGPMRMQVLRKRA